MGKPIDAFGPPVPLSGAGLSEGTDGAAARATHQHGAVDLSALAQNGATSGQVVTWNGSAWAPAAGGGGGGLTQSYLGYNTIGANSENIQISAFPVFFKTFTLAKASLIVSVDCYLKDGGTGNVGGMAVCIFSDVSGSPSKMIAVGRYSGQNTFINNTTAGWVAFGLSAWLPAGTYWASWQCPDNDGTSILQFYDTGGADKSMTETGAWTADTSYYTLSNTTKTYSTRVSILS